MDNEGNLNNKVLNHLECPVCKDYLVAPIQLCGTGHSVCALCREKLEKCPLCQEGFIATRNYGLEAVIDQFRKTCPQCKILLPIRVKNHTFHCIGGLITCQFPKCVWLGPRRLIAEHIKNTHQNVASSINRNQGLAVHVVKYKEHYFWIRRVYEDEHYYWTAQSIFGWNDDEQFYYTIEAKVHGIMYKVTQPCKRNSERIFNLKKDYLNNIPIPIQLTTKHNVNITITDKF